MPNQTLYDNFSQVRQYIDQEKPDLSSYVTKTELSNCGYLTSIPSEYITQQELSGNSYATTSELNSYLPLSGGTLNGDLTLGNTYFLTVGTQRAWKLFEDGSGSGAYICLQAGVDSKYFRVRDMAGNDLLHIYESSNNPAKSEIKNYVNNTYTCSIIPNTDNTYTLGSHSLTKYFQSAYTHRVYLGNQIRIVDDGNNSSTFAIYQGGIGHYSFEPESFHPYGTTYTGVISLGTSSRQWGSTYTSDLYSSNIILSDGYNWIKNVSNTQIDFGVNQYNRAKLTNTEFCPSSNNGIKLGTSTNQWNRTYTGYLYLNGTNIIDTINGIFSYDSTTGTLSITTIS